MANELQFYSNSSNLTITATVYNENGSVRSAGIPCDPSPTANIYIGDMPTSPRGTYGVRFFQGASIIGQGLIHWDGSNEINDRTRDSKSSSIEFG